MIIIAAKDLSNKQVYVSEFQFYPNKTQFTHELNMALPFRDKTHALSWYNGHKQNDQSLGNYYGFKLLTVTEEPLE